MKNKRLMIGGALVAAGIIGAVVIGSPRPDGGTGNDSTGHNQSALNAGDSSGDRSRVNTRITSNFKDVSACDIFTLPDAQQVFHGEAEAAASNGVGDVETNGIHISNCGYNRSAHNVNDIVNVNVMVRAAVNKTGAIANESEFSTLRAGGATAVPGYGDAAFWSQQMSQLHIKVENNWYTISNTKGSRHGTGTLQQSKAVADQIKSKL